jgi:REP element-mobilizing transposase RayT
MLLDIPFLMLYAWLTYYLHVKHESTADLTPFSRGYFAASSGNVTDEVIIKYIEQQGKEPPDGEFKIEN